MYLQDARTRQSGTRAARSLSQVRHMRPAETAKSPSSSSSADPSEQKRSAKHQYGVPVLLAFCSFLLFPSSELDLSLSLPPFDFFDLFFRFDEDFCPPFPACCGDWLPVELEPNWLQRRESTTKSVRWRK